LKNIPFCFCHPFRLRFDIVKVDMQPAPLAPTVLRQFARNRVEE
jgi:hypothetical protein